MYADPHEIRALARRVRDQEAEVRAEGRDLVARAHAVGWTGLSGAAMVARTLMQARALARIAEQHARAAHALDRHADAVEESLARIAEVERRVHAAVAAARSRLRRVVDGVREAADEADGVLAGFVAPPPGSPLWLEVRLPGVVTPGPLR